MSDLLAEAIEIMERSGYAEVLGNVADAARRVLEGEQWMVCETHGSRIRKTRLCEWGWLNRHVAQEPCSIVPKLLVDP